MSLPTPLVSVSGRTIECSAEHPMFVVGKGWRCAGELERGDVLSSHTTTVGVVESVAVSGRVETVYNLRVAYWHTYFVGSDEWGFAVWVHNNELCNLLAIYTHAVKSGNGSGARDAYAKLSAYLRQHPDEITAMAKSADEAQRAAYQKLQKLKLVKPPAKASPKTVAPATANSGKPPVGPRTIDPSTMPLPPGKNNSQFGELVNWPRGTGDHAAKMQMAEANLKAVTPEMVAKLKTEGVTPVILQRWVEFYRAEAIRVPQNPTAAARAHYLDGLLKQMGQ